MSIYYYATRNISKRTSIHSKKYLNVFIKEEKLIKNIKVWRVWLFKYKIYTVC